MRRKSDRAIYWVFALLAGIAAFAFGVSGPHLGDMLTIYHNENLLRQSSAIFGFILVVICTRKLYRMKFGLPEDLKKDDIDRNDERNIQVRRAANSSANLAAAFSLEIMAGLFVLLDYKVPAYIAAGALLLQGIIYVCAHAFYNKRM